MVVNLQVDEKLLKQALDLSNHQTANRLIEAVLHEYIQRRQQLKLLDLFGRIEYEEDYDYKQQRRKE